MTPDKLEQSVENAIKNSGESPKYETETPIAKMQRQVHEINNINRNAYNTKVEEPDILSSAYIKVSNTKAMLSRCTRLRKRLPNE